MAVHVYVKRFLSHEETVALWGISKSALRRRVRELRERSSICIPFLMN